MYACLDENMFSLVFGIGPSVQSHSFLYLALVVISCVIVMSYCMNVFCRLEQQAQ